MRNLKRALSLALASVMLLGMMVVGTSAASTSNFTDADKIVNAEAVDLTTGLDIFKGYTDGSFGPDKAVSRAEAAVVIAKILHGSDVNPANFAGAGKFNDVAPWAEGYVNLVASLGIIVGVGENQFAPDRTVSTVEFSTMLLKALGYYVEADALGADWMLEVTSKANALGLYGDLELAMTAPLTRENVAVMTMNALFAQRVAYDDVRGLYVKNSDRDVVVTNGTVDEYNTLAQNTYGLYAVEGLVVANGMTDMLLEGKTAVDFDEVKDVTGDGKVEAGYSFKTETGLDMIGHAVTVYYTIEKKAPVVYAVVDEATLAVDTILTDNLSNLAKAEGFAKDTSETVFAYNYNLADNTTVTAANYSAKEGQIVKLISNSSDLTVDYAMVIETELDYVDDILVNDADEDDVILSYVLLGNATLKDDVNVIAVNDVEETDYVHVTKIAGRDINGNTLYLVEAAETEVDTIVKVTRRLDTTNALASEAVDFTKSVIAINDSIQKYETGCTDDEAIAVIEYVDVEMKGEYVLIFDTVDRLIGVVPVVVDNTVNAAYVAQFGTKINTDPSLYDNYALYAHIYFADGTDGIYTIDTATKAVDGNAFYGTAGAHTFTFTGAATVYADPKLADGTVATVDNNANINYASDEGFGDYIKLYDVTIKDNGKALIKELPNQGVNYNTTETRYELCEDGTYTWNIASDLDQIKKGVTWMGEEGVSPAPANKVESHYGNSNTMFWFVKGAYSLTDGIDVNVITGMANVPTVDLETSNLDNTTGTTDDDAAIKQATAIQKTGYKAVENVLVSGYDFIEAIDGLYYYDEVYTVIDTKDGYFDLIFTVYDFETGEKTEVIYADHYKSDKAARDAAKTLTNGFYTQGTTADHKLAAYKDASDIAIVDGDLLEDYNNILKTDDAKVNYVIEAKFEKFIKQGDTLTLYTGANTGRYGVTVNADTLLVDLTGNNLSGAALTKLDNMARLIEARDAIWEANDTKNEYTPGAETANLVYDYDKNNQVGIIYVIDILGEYNKDYTGNGTPAVNNTVTSTVLYPNGTGTLALNVTTKENVSGYLYAEVELSIDGGKTWTLAKPEAKIGSFTYNAASGNITGLPTSAGAAVQYRAVVKIVDTNNAVLAEGVVSNATICQ